MGTPSREDVARAALAAAEKATAGGETTSGSTGGGSTDASRSGHRRGRSAPEGQQFARRAHAGHRPDRSASDSHRPGRNTSRNSVDPSAQRDRGGGRPPGDPATLDPEPDPHDVARTIVLTQLTMAPRSRAELEAKLAQRGCPHEVARVVLDRMEEMGLVDDEAYADMFVRSKRTGRGLARSALRSELRKKGLQADVIDAAVAEVSDDDERAEARRLVDKKLRTMHGLPAQTQGRRLAAMLTRKGYPGDMAYAVVREAIREAPEHQRD